jgi:hypothetical protein
LIGGVLFCIGFQYHVIVCVFHRDWLKPAAVGNNWPFCVALGLAAKKPGNTRPSPGHAIGPDSMATNGQRSSSGSSECLSQGIEKGAKKDFMVHFK